MNRTVSDEYDILSKWINSKSNRAYYRLKQEYEYSFELKSAYGSPSSYAFVNFKCYPATELYYGSKIIWPEYLSATECELAISEAIVDTLLSHLYPYKGCALTLMTARWHHLSSSPAAFYKATKSAMEKLLRESDWELSSCTHML